jgi:hypothetical protein
MLPTPALRATPPPREICAETVMKKKKTATSNSEINVKHYHFLP